MKKFFHQCEVYVTCISFEVRLINYSEEAQSNYLKPSSKGFLHQLKLIHQQNYAVSLIKIFFKALKKISQAFSWNTSEM